MSNKLNKLPEIYRYANDLGFRMTRRKGSVDITTKTIYLDYDEYDPVINQYVLSHELGHVQIHRLLSLMNVSIKYHLIKKKHVSLRLFDEGFAWIIGFVLCIRFKVPLKGYCRYAYKCWETYLPKHTIK